MLLKCSIQINLPCGLLNKIAVVLQFVEDHIKRNEWIIGGELLITDPCQRLIWNRWAEQHVGQCDASFDSESPDMPYEILSSSKSGSVLSTVCDRGTERLGAQGTHIIFNLSI